VGGEDHGDGEEVEVRRGDFRKTRYVKLGRPWTVYLFDEGSGLPECGVGNCIIFIPDDFEQFH
jgi:hypothetical protein